MPTAVTLGGGRTLRSPYQPRGLADGAQRVAAGLTMCGVKQRRLVDNERTARPLLDRDGVQSTHQQRHQQQGAGTASTTRPSSPFLSCQTRGRGCGSLLVSLALLELAASGHCALPFLDFASGEEDRGERGGRRIGSEEHLLSTPASVLVLRFAASQIRSLPPWSFQWIFSSFNHFASLGHSSVRRIWGSGILRITEVDERDRVRLERRV